MVSQKRWKSYITFLLKPQSPVLSKPWLQRHLVTKRKVSISDQAPAPIASSLFILCRVVLRRWIQITMCSKNFELWGWSMQLARRATENELKVRCTTEFPILRSNCMIGRLGEECCRICSFRRAIKVWTQQSCSFKWLANDRNSIQLYVNDYLKGKLRPASIARQNQYLLFA